ncbi:DUF192 domain-containing protein [Halomonas sp. NO4]|uniref:DUF192 domain-containing protein n=1 Tax=Halomonas sp. NO4 TaxID=2484813 RepID=UPI0013D6863E|nr:DUF192 domain-containing protein [Halomonas sp. NO4]
MSEGDKGHGGGRRVALLVAVWLLTMAASAVAASVTFEHRPLVIHTGEAAHRLTVEVARTPAQRSRGLMARDSLAEDAGMLFLYPRQQPPWGSFWMYRTRIPLDIAFVDATGRIAAIHTMQPCGSADPGDCPSTQAGVPYRAALEVNAGYFAARGIDVGDCVVWPDQADGCAASGQRD